MRNQENCFYSSEAIKSLLNLVSRAVLGNKKKKKKKTQNMPSMSLKVRKSKPTSSFIGNKHCHI